MKPNLRIYQTYSSQSNREGGGGGGGLNIFNRPNLCPRFCISLKQTHIDTKMREVGGGGGGGLNIFNRPNLCPRFCISLKQTHIDTKMQEVGGGGGGLNMLKNARDDCKTDYKADITQPEQQIIRQQQ